jgi:broad specificity phosphatase PhoE
VATTLILVRHAVHGLVDRVLCGRSPSVHLSEEGRQQAVLLGQRLRPLRPAAV